MDRDMKLSRKDVKRIIEEAIEESGLDSVLSLPGRPDKRLGIEHDSWVASLMHKRGGGIHVRVNLIGELTEEDIKRQIVEKIEEEMSARRLE